MYIKTANGYVSLWSISKPKAEPVAWERGQGKWSLEETVERDKERQRYMDRQNEILLHGREIAIERGRVPA